MLTRNCVKKLFRPNDTNVRVTMFKPATSHNPFEYKSAWLETIQTSLGKGVTNSKTPHFIEITDITGYYSNAFMTGKQLLSKLRDSFEKPVSVRITLSGWPTRSWLIILEEDLALLDN